MDVRTGIDRLAAGEGPSLRSSPVALLCHPASVSRDLVPTQKILARTGARIVSLLGPEHGIDAAAQDMEGVGDDVATADEGPPVYSLYGETFDSLRPTQAMFHDAEWLVVDLQDVGARYYTYVWTALMAVEEALKAQRKVLILDRPNPLGGTDSGVEGGAIQAGQESFVGYHNVAVRHGMTLAEIVTMALAERGVRVGDALTVLECAGWRRDALFSETGLPWVLPSPNMPTLETALVYPGQCLWEGTNVSEGRGTTRPFEFFGAPFIDGEALLGALEPEDFPGLALRTAQFKPTFQKHGGESCGGLQLHVRAAHEVRSLKSTWALLAECWRRWPDSCRWRTERYEFVEDRPAIDLLAGGAWLREMVEAGARVAELEASQVEGRASFIARRAPFLRYA